MYFDCLEPVQVARTMPDTVCRARPRLAAVTNPGVGWRGPTIVRWGWPLVNLGISSSARALALTVVGRACGSGVTDRVGVALCLPLQGWGSVAVCSAGRGQRRWLPEQGS